MQKFISLSCRYLHQHMELVSWSQYPKHSRNNLQMRIIFLRRDEPAHGAYRREYQRGQRRHARDKDYSEARSDTRNCSATSLGGINRRSSTRSTAASVHFTTESIIEMQWRRVSVIRFNQFLLI